MKWYEVYVTDLRTDRCLPAIHQIQASSREDAFCRVRAMYGNSTHFSFCIEGEVLNG